jgi:hypothetical protein
MTTPVRIDREATCWQARDYGDGWITFFDADEAARYQLDTGALVRNLYTALPASVERVPEGGILDRGNEIEADFYRLKSYEWACQAWEAKTAILAALEPVCAAFIKAHLAAASSPDGGGG